MSTINNGIKYGKINIKQGEFGAKYSVIYSKLDIK